MLMPSFHSGKEGSPFFGLALNMLPGSLSMMKLLHCFLAVLWWCSPVPAADIPDAEKAEYGGYPGRYILLRNRPSTAYRLIIPTPQPQIMGPSTASRRKRASTENPFPASQPAASATSPLKETPQGKKTSSCSPRASGGKPAALPTLTTFSTAVWKRCATMAALLPAP